MSRTAGLNHLGLSVRNLDETTRFFTQALGWEDLGRDDSYPRSTVSDGKLRLTLWQVDQDEGMTAFDRRKNVGLHHVAIEVASKDALFELARDVAAWPGVSMEFPPELLGTGPRMHTMFAEPGGIRLELIWPGT